MKENLQIYKTAHLDEQTKRQLLLLWNAEYPAKLSYDMVEFEVYLQNLFNVEHFLLASESKLVRGWAFTFERQDERWFAVILSKEVQGRGWGRKMLDVLKQSENVFNGWVIDHNNDRKINGDVYTSPINFYERNGFEVLNGIRLELDKISAVKIRWMASGKKNQAQ
jgi:GNAT superfamily N-acetyltransferase